jgi:hypothetical protein
MDHIKMLVKILSLLAQVDLFFHSLLSSHLRSFITLHPAWTHMYKQNNEC